MTEDEHEEAVIEAKDQLAKAIQHFVTVADGPAAYLDGYVVVMHKLTPEMEAVGGTTVGTLVATGQSFALTRGLLEVGLDAVRG